MIYGLIAMFAAFVLLLADRFIERRGWIKERNSLLDRIQAHSLAEYKAYAPNNAVKDDKNTPTEEPEQV